jgi:hypothetical protein
MAEHLEEQLKKITLRESVAPRPGNGTLGIKVTLQANHLKVTKVFK